MRMDKSGKMCPELQTEPGRRGAPVNQWESGECDAESPAQERAHQHQLRHRDRHRYPLPVKENLESLQQGDGEEGDETEDLHIYDSLELASNPRAKRSPALLQTEYLDTQMDEGEGSRLLSDDAYSDLRHDPNWRTDLKRNGRFLESPQTSVEELDHVSVEEYAQPHGDRQGREMKGGYRYIADAIPPVVVTPNVADEKSQRPRRHHPEDGQTPRCHGHALREADLSGVSTKEEIDESSQMRTRETRGNSCDGTADNISRCTQKTSTSAPTSSRVPPNKKQQRQEGIVERNKITLGRNTSKRGSYVRRHALKRDTPRNVEEVPETLEETAPTGDQEDSSDPELTLLHKTQELRVTQISMGKNAERKEHPDPSEQKQSPAVAVKAERGDCWSVPSAQAAAVTPLKPQTTTSSQPSPPAFLHNSLNTSSHRLSSIQQRGRDAAIDSASLHGYPHCRPESEVQLALFTGHQEKTSPGQSSHMSREVPHALSSPEQWQRTSALQWQSPCGEEEPNWSLDEVLSEPCPQSLPRSPGSYTVLPPIVGKPLAGEEAAPSAGQTVNTADPSDSYLVQMERQRQLRARAAYKADEQRKTELNQRGLHPHYAAIEKTKMKRQRLYSNVIREQNKQMSRIPFLPAKDPEGSDNKVPRMKALEYAKTIAKPPVKSQPKPRQRSQTEGVAEHAPHSRDLDSTELTRLKLLRKRHEEEKQAVALLGRADAV
ncbi:jhy protein homolog isoform X2 [Scophthalmus maximus]|uniref:jhy protein homolog isoform X2 n=1 Tax=Scophthalmus maximus TaxID=52904 RepID=UPI0015E06DAA|nr:jhy protein homolog isoform X2 [Scophthalmus maximus]